MYSSTLILFGIWECILLICTIWLCNINIKLFKAAKKKKKDADTYAANIKLRTDEKYNKYISLTPDELDKRLATIFSAMLELSSVIYVSEKDPSRAEILYTKATERLLIYLGNDTINAIEYYYGKGYVVRWCELQYQLLENHGELSKILEKQVYTNNSVMDDSLR